MTPGCGKGKLSPATAHFSGVTPWSLRFFFWFFFFLNLLQIIFANKEKHFVQYSFWAWEFNLLNKDNGNCKKTTVFTVLFLLNSLLSSPPYLHPFSPFLLFRRDWISLQLVNCAVITQAALLNWTGWILLCSDTGLPLKTHPDKPHRLHPAWWSPLSICSRTLLFFVNGFSLPCCAFNPNVWFKLSQSPIVACCNVWRDERSLHSQRSSLSSYGRLNETSKESIN